MILHLPSRDVIAQNSEWMLNSIQRSKGLLKFDRAPDSYAGIFHLPFGGFFPLMHTFGMKFPIDIFFLDKTFRVLFAQREVSSRRFVMPSFPYFLYGVKYVIEFVNCNTSKVASGDRLELKL